MKFNFNIIKPKPKEEKIKIKKETVIGIIEYHEPNYVFIQIGSKIPIPLSDKSFSCKGFNIIYVRVDNISLRPVKIIRDTKDATIKRYIPFRHGLLVKGSIIVENGINKFLLKKNDLDGKTK